MDFIVGFLWIYCLISCFNLFFSLRLFGRRLISIPGSCNVYSKLVLTLKMFQRSLIIRVAGGRVLFNVDTDGTLSIFIFGLSFRVSCLEVNMALVVWFYINVRGYLRAKNVKVYRFVFLFRCQLIRFFFIWSPVSRKASFWDVWGEKISNGDCCVVVVCSCHYI